MKADNKLGTGMNPKLTIHFGVQVIPKLSPEPNWAKKYLNWQLGSLFLLAMTYQECNPIMNPGSDLLTGSIFVLLELSFTLLACIYSETAASNLFRVSMTSLGSAVSMR